MRVHTRMHAGYPPRCPPPPQHTHLKEGGEADVSMVADFFSTGSVPQAT